MDNTTLNLLEQSLKTNPENEELRLHLSELYFEEGSYQKALEILSVIKAPKNEKVQLLQAAIELELEPSKALQTLNEVLEKNKASGNAYLLKAKLYVKQGLLAEAQKEYQRAVLMDETLINLNFEKQLQGQQQQPALKLVHSHLAEDHTPSTFLNQSISPLEEKITFQNVGGMEEVKERIRMNIIYPFKNPQVFAKFNRKAGGGLLLYGPPGCGKTFIARATAGECDANFVSVGIVDVLSKWIGESENRLHEIFETARRKAPSILFIDEIDALGMNRKDASSSLSPLINVFLTELDGIQSANENVLVLGATNSPWYMDSAFRRPGRFDKIMFVPPPDVLARELIFKIYLEKTPHEEINYAQLSKLTPLFSGSDIRSVVDQAAEHAIYEEMKTGQPSKINQKSLLKVIKDSQASTLEWIESAKNYANFANKAGIYDELSEFLRKI